MLVLKFDPNCVTFYASFILAIIVTGSLGSMRRSVEVLKDDGSSLCSLPDLPFDHYGHTQSGLVTCGGRYAQTSCYTFSAGVWTESHSLLQSRYWHSSWSSPLGTVLIGSTNSRTTTELLMDDDQSTELFSLKYSTPPLLCNSSFCPF